MFLIGAGLAWAACGGGDAEPSDAAPAPGDARVIPDAAATMQDGGQSLSWVDFSVTGCEPALAAALAEGLVDMNTVNTGSEDTGPADAGAADAAPDSHPPDGGPDADVRPCRGRAPLTLRFAAVAPASIDVHVWEFGDEGSASTPTPIHVYEQPGTYDVRLTVRGPGGTASHTRSRAVEVVPAGLGGPCRLEEQCSTGQMCVCDQDSACPANLAGGMCSTTCGPANPCAEGVCVDLAASRPAPAAEWQQPLCLLPCTPDGTCPHGLTCQDLPAAHAASDEDGDGWVRACFAPGVLRPMGASCLDADGVPDHALCAGGRCLAVGARGMCTAPCVSGTCPPSAACASMGAQSVCLARCEDASTDCRHDPWLACEPPGRFTVDEPAAEAGYCAARSCTEAADCGPDGACVGDLCTAR
jgi:PKD repeat protein